MRMNKRIFIIFLLVFAFSLDVLTTEVSCMKSVAVEKEASFSYSKESRNEFIIKNVLIARIDSSVITDQSGNSYDISEAKIIKNNVGAPKLAELWVKDEKIVLVVLK